jgi:hypothetical protein
MGKVLLRCAGLVGALVFSIPAFAVESSAPPIVATLVHGVDGVKPGARAAITVVDGALKLTCKSGSGQIDAASIDEIFLASETTQQGGRYGTAAKVMAKAAPYGTGSLMSLILWVRIDVMTVLYHGEYGELHSALLTMPHGKAEAIRAQLQAARDQVSTKAE